jgi:uncharacterized protein (DUF305 family)
MRVSFVRTALWASSVLLLLAACVPVQPNGADSPEAMHTAAAQMAEPTVAPATGPATGSMTEPVTVTGIVTPNVSGLLLATPVVVEATGPISPNHSVIGPVGEPVMHDSSAASASESTDHTMHMVQDDLPVDLAFIDDMIAHHQGALEMAQDLLLNTERPELVEMANAILATQAVEIEQMQAWRAEWYSDAPASTDEAMGMAMGDMAVSDDASVPYDRRFLQAMISHHMGAVAMAQMVLEQGQRPEVKELAQAIITAQEAEIAQMQNWLREWYGE